MTTALLFSKAVTWPSALRNLERAGEACECRRLRGALCRLLPCLHTSPVISSLCLAFPKPGCPRRFFVLVFIFPQCNRFGHPTEGCTGLPLQQAHPHTPLTTHQAFCFVISLVSFSPVIKLRPSGRACAPATPSVPRRAGTQTRLGHLLKEDFLLLRNLEH